MTPVVEAFDHPIFAESIRRIRLLLGETGRRA